MIARPALKTRPVLALFTSCSRHRLLVRPWSLSLLHSKTVFPLLYTSSRLSSTLTERKAAEASSSDDSKIYHGPLSTTFKRLKLFSLGSLGLSVTLAPFMFLVESSLPGPARLALASIAIGTSGLSTALVGWCGSPYVHTLRRITKDGREGLKLITYSLTLQLRITMVYDPYFLIETRRPFAKWELAKELTLPPERPLSSIVPGREETVAETLNDDGTILGRWIVQWDENGRGRCHEAGSVIRHFNVHEELLR